MTIRSTSVRSLAVAAMLLSLSARADAQIDLQAERAYLRTGVNSGSEVTTPALGQKVFVHIDYRVVGGTAPVTATVRALIDGVEHCMGSITFNPNSSDQSIWCPEAIDAAAGTHTLRWELDTQSQVSESNETNNTAEFTFTTAATGSRDLEALRAYLRTQPNGGDEVASPTLGQQVYLHIEYRVGAEGTAFMASVEAMLDGSGFCNGPISFTPGLDGVVWCPTAWTATEGSHTLRWEVDSEGQINETDESNNVAEVTFTTGGSTAVDILAERAFLRTAVNAGDEVTQPDVGQQVYVHADYDIIGVSTPLSGGVRALIDDQEHCAGTISFGTEAATVWCENAWTATAGTHTLRWILDSADEIDETNEQNNSVTATFTVGGPAVCTGDCDEGGSVVVNELVTGVNILLERADIEDCPQFDSDGGGTVTVNELVSGVDNLLSGCR